jgi:hypothetical protein
LREFLREFLRDPVLLGSGRKAVRKLDLCLAQTAAKLHVSARDQEAAPDAFDVVIFVPAHADIRRFSERQTAFDRRNLLIDMTAANELRIRNAWVRGSNPLCGTKFYL